MINITTEQQHIIQYLALSNNHDYNIIKAAEEFSELVTVLLQKTLKHERVPDQEVIDEIGDAIIRLEILKRLFNPVAIQNRVDYKLGKFEEYIKENKYLNHI
jgi:hypothetical protein